MKKLFESADLYLQSATWKDLTLVKFCLAAIGILIGLQVPKSHKKSVMVGALSIFAATYIPLMTKYFRIVLKKEDAE